MCASSSLREQTMLVRIPLSAYFYVARQLNALAIAFVNKLLVRVPLSACFYVAPANERALAVVFVNKLCWFESHCRHVLCNLGR